MTEKISPEMQQKIQEYMESQQRARLLMSQKYQIELSLKEFQNALDELEKLEKAEVHKAVGQILIKSDKKDVVEDLKEKIETLETRMKTIESQEKKLTEKMEKYFKSNNIEKFYESNKAIHEIFLKKSNNQSIYDLISNLNLRKKLFRYRVTFLARRDVMKKALDDHKKILAAFSARDSDAIEKLIREHWISDSRIREFENGSKTIIKS